MQDETERTVVHLHFLRWRDKSVPDDLFSLLAFRRKVRSLDAVASGPLLIHCSAGVGRTGTYMALDMLLDEARQSGEVDILDVVSHLRRQRMTLVQTKVSPSLHEHLPVMLRRMTATQTHQVHLQSF